MRTLSTSPGCQRAETFVVHNSANPMKTEFELLDTFSTEIIAAIEDPAYKMVIDKNTDTLQNEAHFSALIHPLC